MDQTYNILALVVLGLGLELILAYKLHTDKKRFEKIDQEYQNELQQVKKQLNKVISATRAESQEIITELLNQYHTVQSEVGSFTLKLQQKIDDVTDEIVEQQKELLKKHAQDSAKELVETTGAQIKTLSTVLQDTIAQSQTKISQELSQQLQTAQKEIADFKTKQIDQFSNQSEELISGVATKYMIENLDRSQLHKVTLQLIEELWQEKKNNG